MKLKNVPLTLAIVAMWLCSNQAMAAYEHLADRPAQPTSKASAPASKMTNNQLLSKVKSGPKVKLVDINSANKAALKRLPGVTEADVDKIIANRPYGSKAWLVTSKVVDDKTYGAIKALVEAKQPYKTAEKNAALYQKLAAK